MGQKQSSLEKTEGKGELNKESVNGAVDASRVRVTGCGLEDGIVTEYKGRFSVETSGAGPGSLNVKINGPKGGFKVETFRDHDWDRTVSCRYDPVETGVYEIYVKWGGVDVPGSPFKVNVAESQEKLKKMKKTNK